MTEVVGTRTGGRAAAERAAAEKAEREKNKGALFRNFTYGMWDAPAEGELYGESKILRIVTDEPDWHEVLQHSFVPTKAAPKDKPSDKKWPTRWGAVCRYTIVPKRKSKNEIIETEWFDDCYIHDNIWLPGKDGKPDYHPRATPRQWAWAVEREEVLGTKEMFEAGEIEEDQVGDVVSYRDVEVDYYDSETQEITKIQKWLVLNFGNQNFFDKLLGYNNVYHTVVDRDYKVTRKYGGTETDYEIVALDPVYEEIKGKSVKVDLRKSPFKERYQPPVTLFSLISEQVSDDHYNWWFNADVETSWVERYGQPKDKDESSSADSPVTDTATSADSSSDGGGDDEAHRVTMNAIRERMRASKATASV